ncbi:hypothetical protein ACFSUK_25145 [Sphingobium scionense]
MLAAGSARAAGVETDPIKDMIVINALGGLGDPNQPPAPSFRNSARACWPKPMRRA